MGQYRRLGASLAYDRERFTMDPGYVEAVMRFFVHCWERGWMYRANRIVNWCPFHETAISDLEVVHEPMDDTLVFARYPFTDGSGSITVATVRPATMLADVAVAVHPEDERYRDAVGKEVVVPFVERAVPVVADELVEPEFGTGALKVTPGHDPVDFEIGQRHDLDVLTVIGLDGRMNEAAGELVGLTQKEADKAVVAWLEERDLLEKREPYRHNVGTCERCHTRIEPLVSLQWWLAMEEPRKPALAALRERRVRYHPESQHAFAVRSLEEIPDWNVSRQLWWGHQLPIWYCPDGHATCAWPPPEACADCGSGELVRDPDVLDTWFSSALWPYATLGWPEDTEDLRRYYPGDVNSTAREIIRLWENRMIWTGLELVGDLPFHDVIIHSTVLAPDGRRMSKSLGTGIDPLEMIDAHGADATRYGLLKMSSTQDVRFSEGALAEGWKLGVKLWNVSRLVLANTAGAEPEARPQSLEERWILARLDAARAEVEEAWGRFDFSAGVKALYGLTFDDFCDWYAEAIKPRLYEDDPDAAATALAALERLLALLHPVHAARHRGDLVAAAGPRGAPDRLALAGARRPLRRGCRRPGARPRRGRDRQAERRRRRASRGRAPDLRRGRPQGAAAPERQPRGRDRAAAQGGRALRGDARQRQLRRQRAARGGRGRAREAGPLPARARCARRVSTSPGWRR